MVTRTAGCKMIISGWVYSIVRKFLTFFIKELGRPKKDENDPNHGISGGKAYKTILYCFNRLLLNQLPNQHNYLISQQ